MFESAASKYQCDSEEFSSAVRENKTAFNPIFDNKLLPGRFEPQQCRIIWFQAPVLGWCTGVFGGICFDSEMTNHVRYELRQHKAEKSAKTKWNCFAGGEKMSSLISGIGQCWKEKWRNKNGHGFWIWSFRITMLHDCVVRYVSLLDAMSVIHLMGTEIDWKRILRGLSQDNHKQKTNKQTNKQTTTSHFKKTKINWGCPMSFDVTNHLKRKHHEYVRLNFAYI